MRLWIICLLAFCLPHLALSAQPKPTWRAATPAELEAFLPARAPVEKERIETELRTATGITDDHGHTIAAVVLITAGYAADGKYSHYLLTQSPLHLGTEITLPAGAYVLGWSRGPDGLLVHIFDAATGAERGNVAAHASKQPIRIESFKIWPPADRPTIQIGRFLLPYTLEP
ncbi:hypothetical protein [Granulicella sibirica]|uniref:Uncharacterized protein n=1 Tax=Granulicella sibirica TaxID=2479048 RepID=A0A4Q0T5D6_9BACT|nr:hypothetical protein [Granulicella sibirica]RXH58933.1 hypothetical protein GRAN_2243 [Granulicella sibirica]